MKAKNGGNTAAKVYELAKPIADELGYVIWDVCYEKEGSNRYLRVFIDKDEGYIDIDDCEKMTRPLSKALDDADPVEESYILEVGSAGGERVLKKPVHFERCMGERAVARLIRPADGLKERFGVLTAYDKESVTLTDGENTFTVKLGDTAYVKAYIGDGFVFSGYTPEGTYKVDYDFSEK